MSGLFFGSWIHSNFYFPREIKKFSEWILPLLLLLLWETSKRQLDYFFERGERGGRANGCCTSILLWRELRDPPPVYGKSESPPLPTEKSPLLDYATKKRRGALLLFWGRCEGERKNRKRDGCCFLFSRGDCSWTNGAGP